MNTNLTFKLNKIAFNNSCNSNFVSLSFEENTHISGRNGSGKSSKLNGVQLGFLPQVTFKNSNKYFYFKSSKGNFYKDEECYDFYFPYKNSFIIYQGHHGGYGSKNADIILPGSAFTEKNSTFVNLEGRPQNTFKCCNPPGDAKEDWKIINAIAKKFNTKFNYFSVEDVKNRLRKVNPIVFSSVNTIFDETLYFFK